MARAEFVYPRLVRLVAGGLHLHGKAAAVGRVGGIHDDVAVRAYRRVGFDAQRRTARAASVRAERHQRKGLRGVVSGGRLAFGADTCGQRVLVGTRRAHHRAARRSHGQRDRLRQTRALRTRAAGRAVGGDGVDICRQALRERVPAVDTRRPHELVWSVEEVVRDVRALDGRRDAVRPLEAERRLAGSASEVGRGRHAERRVAVTGPGVAAAGGLRIADEEGGDDLRIVRFADPRLRGSGAVE